MQMMTLLVILFALFELVLIPGFLIWRLGWMGLGIWAVFFLIVRPLVGAHKHSRIGVLFDFLFTLGIAIFAFIEEYWIVGSVLLAYLLLNQILSGISNKEKERQANLEKLRENINAALREEDKEHL